MDDLNAFMKDNDIFLKYGERGELDIRFIRSRGQIAYKYFVTFKSKDGFVYICSNGTCGSESGEGNTKEEALFNFLSRIKGQTLLHQKYKKRLLRKDLVINKRTIIPPLLTRK